MPADGHVTARIGAVVLAAGLSSRSASGNKLLADVAGKPLIVRTLEAMCATRCSPVVVVTGHMADQVEKIVQHLPVTVVCNPDFSCGMAVSIAAGVAALPEDVAGALICLGDMALIGPAVFDRLFDAFDESNSHSICVPVHQGRHGHPVLFGRAHFAALRGLSGDQGARSIVNANPDCVRMVSCPDDTIRQDADTDEALELLRRRFT